MLPQLIPRKQIEENDKVRSVYGGSVLRIERNLAKFDAHGQLIFVESVVVTQGCVATTLSTKTN